MYHSKHSSTSLNALSLIASVEMLVTWPRTMSAITCGPLNRQINLVNLHQHSKMPKNIYIELEKAFTRGRTDHFSNILGRLFTYLQFKIQPCLLATEGHLSSCWALVSYCDRPLTLTCDFDLLKWPKRCQGEPIWQISCQRSFRSKVIVRTHRQTDRQTHTPDRLLYLDH